MLKDDRVFILYTNERIVCYFPISKKCYIKDGIWTNIDILKFPDMLKCCFNTFPIFQLRYGWEVRILIEEHNNRKPNSYYRDFFKTFVKLFPSIFPIITYTGSSRNRFPTLEARRPHSIGPKESKFELQII